MRDDQAGERFAAAVQELKRQTGLSYGALAKRLHVSTSTLHRYCSGAAVPAEYAPVERLARLCGAGPDQLVELHRLWVLADAERRRSRGASAAANGAAARRTARGRAAASPAAPATDAQDDDGEGAASEPAERRAPEEPDGPVTPDDVAPAPPTVPPEAAGEAIPDAPIDDAASEQAAADPSDGTGAGHVEEAAPADTRSSRPAGGSAAPDASPSSEAPEAPTEAAAPGDAPPHPAPATTPRRMPGLKRRHRAPAAALVLVLLGALLLVGGRWWTGERTAGTVDVADPSDEPQGDHGPADPTSPSAEEPPPPADDEVTDESAAGPQGESEPSDDGAEDAPPEAPDDLNSPAPLTWSVRDQVWNQGCSHRYLVDRAPGDVPAPPVPQDADGWVAETAAVHAGLSIVEATVRPVSENDRIVIEAAHLRIADRGDPLPWNVYATGDGCGGSLDVAAFTADLDASAPRLVPTEGFDGQTEEVLPAPSLPYQVTADDPLLLRIEAETVRCDCSWTVDLEWSSGPRRGTVTIDDDGRPFRTSGAPDDAVHMYRDGQWAVEGP